MIKLLRFISGIILFLVLWGISLELISCANTIGNIIGMLLAVSIAYLAIKTRFLLKLNIKKDEK